MDEKMSPAEKIFLQQKRMGEPEEGKPPNSCNSFCINCTHAALTAAVELDEELELKDPIVMREHMVYARSWRSRT